MMSLVIDGLLIVMLAGTLAYAMTVHRKLRRLISVLQNLEPVVNQFSAAVDKSEQSVSNMKTAAQKAALHVEVEPVVHQVQPREGATFRTQRPKPLASLPRLRDIEVPGATRISGKADLVKSFFDTNRGLNSW